MKKQRTDAEEVEWIREWLDRHRHDYCIHDNAPPKAWSEFMETLLRICESRIDPASAKEGQ